MVALSHVECDRSMEFKVNFLYLINVDKYQQILMYRVRRDITNNIDETLLCMIVYFFFSLSRGCNKTVLPALNNTLSVDY